MTPASSLHSIQYFGLTHADTKALRRPVYLLRFPV